MKFLTLFVFAFVCLAVLIAQSQVEAQRGGSNIVLKDGNLILSSSGRRKRGGM